MKDEKKKQAASEEVKAEAKADSAKASDAGKTADEAEARDAAEFIKKLYGVDSRVDIEESTGRMNIVYLPRHWKKETPQVST